MIPLSSRTRSTGQAVTNEAREQGCSRSADVFRENVEGSGQCVLDYLARDETNDELVEGEAFLVVEASGEVVREALVIHIRAPSSPPFSPPPDPLYSSHPFDFAFPPTWKAKKSQKLQ